MANSFPKVGFLLWGLCIAIACTACTKGNAETASAEKPIAATAAQTTQHSAPETEENAEKAGVYEGSPQHFSEEDIDRFLSHCGDGVASSQKDTGDTHIKYSGTTNKGKTFLSLKSTGYHPHEVFQYVDEERYAIYREYPIYAGEEAYETNAQYSVGWMFTEPKDFSFATAEEAEKTVRTALAALGVTDITLLRTLYIDHNTMEAAGKKLASDPAYAPIGEPQENNGYTLREDWSEADDAYMFSFGIAVENTPLSTRFEIQDTATYTGSKIIVWYSGNGIDFLSVDMPWKIGRLLQEPQKIISSEEALAIVKNQLDGILTYQNVSYYDPFLEYRYKQEKDTWILYPVWTVKVSYQMMTNADTASDVMYRFLCVDARTGEAL